MLEAFYRLPVRAAGWLVVRGKNVVRSDDWLGEGQRRRDVAIALSEKLFVDTCTDWLLYGCSSIDELGLPEKVRDYNGEEMDAKDAAQWLIDVLTAIEPFVPSLREYRTQVATRGRGDTKGSTKA